MPVTKPLAYTGPYAREGVKQNNDIAKIGSGSLEAVFQEAVYASVAARNV